MVALKEFSKSQLIDQVTDLSDRLNQFEKEKNQVERSLRERIKELNCLYSIAELNEKNNDSINDILIGTANLIPSSWQYPEITCSRIFFRNRTFTSSIFHQSKWCQTADLKMEGKNVGKIEVFYVKQMPISDEGPFLKEERLLINAIAERLGRIIERIETKQQLLIEQESLKTINVALEGVLKKMKEEKAEVSRSIQMNMENLLMPIIHQIELESSETQREYIRLLKKNIKEMISPFSLSLSDPFKGLSPAEMQISDMIKNGLTSKEIANLRRISISTVNRHRENIRKKLGLQNEKVNLMQYLCSMAKQS